MSFSFCPATYYFLGLDRGVYPWYKEVHFSHVIQYMSRGRAGGTISHVLRWKTQSIVTSQCSSSPLSQPYLLRDQLRAQKPSLLHLRALKGVPQNFSTYLFLSMDKSHKGSCLNSTFSYITSNFKGHWDLKKGAATQKVLRASLYTSKHYSQ